MNATQRRGDTEAQRQGLDQLPLIVWILLVASTGICGCAQRPPEHLRTYSWTGEASALRMMKQRAESVRTVSAQCLIILTRPDGESIRLDGATVLAPQDGEVRLRAWKLNHAVIDLTLNRSGLWIESAREDARRQSMLPASLNAAQVARAMSLFGGGLLDGPGVEVFDHGGPLFQIRKRLENGQSVRATVDRATLVVREYELRDPSGAARFTMSLPGYDNVAGIPWPTGLVANSASGKIEMQFRDVEINQPLPDRAFDPPPRAEKVQ